jgi:hypothetical protein
MGVPIICLGCNERAEIPFIPADLTCVACKTGEHIDLDDGIETTAVLDPSDPMMLLPSGVPEQDQDMGLLDEDGKKRKVVVPKGSAPYSQRALASRLDPKSAAACPDCNGSGSVPAGGGEDPDDVDNGYVQCPTCKGVGKTASLTKQADLSGIRNLLAQFNGKNVTVTYDDDLGLHTVAGPLTYHPPAVMVGKSATTDVHVLQITVNGYGDFPDARTEPVREPGLADLLQTGLSGATAKTAAYVPHKWVDSDGYTACIVCGIPEEDAAPVNGPLVGCLGSTPPNEPPPYHDPMDEPLSQYASKEAASSEVCPKCSSKINPVQYGNTLQAKCKSCGWSGSKTKSTANPERTKVAQIAAAVLATNPGMSREAALAVAEKTVARYPKVAGGFELDGETLFPDVEFTKKTCPDCGGMGSHEDTSGKQVFVRKMCETCNGTGSVSKDAKVAAKTAADGNWDQGYADGVMDAREGQAKAAPSTDLDIKIDLAYWSGYDAGYSEEKSGVSLLPGETRTL